MFVATDPRGPPSPSLLMLLFGRRPSPTTIALEDNPPIPDLVQPQVAAQNHTINGHDTNTPENNDLLFGLDNKDESESKGDNRNIRQRRMN